MPIVSALLSLVGGFFSSLFAFKGEQAKTVASAIDVLKSVNDVDGVTTTAAAQSLSAILTQGSFLEKNWRPIFMLICIIILVASFFGYRPAYFDLPVTPTMEKIWTMLQIGLGGYLPLRTLEKVIATFNISSILKELIKKKVV